MVRAVLGLWCDPIYGYAVTWYGAIYVFGVALSMPMVQRDVWLWRAIWYVYGMSISPL